MQLHHEYSRAVSTPAKGTIVLIHGLFGSLSNLGMIARAFQDDFDIIQLDLRNHGRSEHDAQISYAQMAFDVLETLNARQVQNFIVIGHSMGGKVAMKIADLADSRVEKLIVLDMAPVAYTNRHHDQIFEALFDVVSAQVESRKQATEIMQNKINELGVIQFLLKSFDHGQWRFNVQALYQNYDTIISWSNIPLNSTPSLFIRGANSPYLAQEAYLEAIQMQFDHAQVVTVENAGHWLHAEQPEKVIQLIRDFI